MSCSWSVANTEKLGAERDVSLDVAFSICLLSPSSSKVCAFCSSTAAHVMSCNVKEYL